MSDSVLMKMRATPIKYADQDPASLNELRARIFAAGLRDEPITYSDLVRGVTFHIGTVHEGQPFEIDVHHWTELDRAIVGDFLGVISTESYEAGGFMASALAVSADELRPSQSFFRWMHEVGALASSDETTELTFWTDQMRRAHAWYSSHGAEAP